VSSSAARAMPMVLREGAIVAQTWCCFAAPHAVNRIDSHHARIARRSIDARCCWDDTSV